MRVIEKEREEDRNHGVCPVHKTNLSRSIFYDVIDIRWIEMDLGRRFVYIICVFSFGWFWIFPNQVTHPSL